MIPVIDNFRALNGDADHHWVRFFRAHPPAKIKLVRWAERERSEGVMQAVLDYFLANGSLRPGSLGLVTYTGFKESPNGWIYRDLHTKRFDVWAGKIPPLYISEGWDLRDTEFQRSMPVVVTEGLLDAEATAVMSGYPYCACQLGSSLSEDACRAIGLVTDHVVLLGDNDRAGQRGTQKTQRALRQLGVGCTIIIEDSAKDAAALWLRQDAVEIAKFRLRVMNAVGR